MKSKIVLLIFLLASFNSAWAFSFNGKLPTKVIQTDDTNLKFEVTKYPHSNKALREGSYPIGTVFTAKKVAFVERKRFSRDAKLTVELKEAILPNGHREALNRKLRIRAVNRQEPLEYTGNVLIGVTGLVLGLTIDALTVALPVVRGGSAVWSAGHYIYEAPEGSSKTKAGLDGFMRGAFRPIPWMILKGDKLDIHKGSIIYIGKAKSDPDKLMKAGLIKKYN
jgi:hypothetical protein